MKEWEKTLGRGTHLQRIAHQVYNLNQGGTYTWCWNKASDGYYTVKLAYLKNLVHSVANSSNRATNKAFEKLCRCWAPRRYTTMVWKLLKRRMTTKDNLRRRDEANWLRSLRLCGLELYGIFGKLETI
ncbi:hypothetical protein ACS0TY_030045 [Phlomoides rotata]